MISDEEYDAMVKEWSRMYQELKDKYEALLKIMEGGEKKNDENKIIRFDPDPFWNGSLDGVHQTNPNK